MPKDGSHTASDCCIAESTVDAPQTGQNHHVGLWTTGGAVLTAIFASACCWLPFLLIGFGASAAGVSGFFEAYRPYLLGATVLLLGGGFYFVYFRKERCEQGSACAIPDPRLKRLNKGMPWVASAVVLALALFPNYVGFLIRGGGDDAVALAAKGAESRLYHIEGMTCEGCAAHLETRLQELPGVSRAVVSYPERTARVYVNSGQSAPDDQAVQEIAGQLGYKSMPSLEMGNGVAEGTE